MSERWIEKRLKNIGNKVVETAGVTLVLLVVGQLGTVGWVLWLALRGDSHRPWFYALCGALAFSTFAILVVTILVVVQSLRKKQVVSIAEVGESRFKEMEWAYGRTQEQAQQLERVVSVEEFQVLPSGVMRTTDPYIEFIVTIGSRSLFDLQVEELSGVLALGNWELRQRVAWLARPEERIIWANNRTSFSFRQDLTPEDVAEMQKAETQFNVSRFELSVTGFDKSADLVKSQRINWGGNIPTNGRVMAFIEEELAKRR